MLDYLDALAHAETLEDVWNLHCEEMARYGFDRLLYGYTRFITEETLGEFEDAVFLTNHDSAYFDRFIGERLFLQTPMFRWARHHGGARSWGDFWDDTQGLSEKEKEIIAFNRQMNVTAGYSISFANPSPRAFGMISLTARSGLDQADVDEIWGRDGRVIEAINHMAHLKIMSLPHRTARAGLSDRQREVLEWVGEGKSNLDIATILGVTVATVEKHLRLAREKLGVETTAHAILKASFQNQIFQD
ncbi:MAG TPA: LuxR family transcriptional regulator [Rhodobacterales bacterium]|nr:LuxR family transcriptional regulator [Rhodobacterales bacterium]